MIWAEEIRSRINRCCDFARPRLGAAAPPAFESRPRNAKAPARGAFAFRAEAERFELSRGCPLHAFQACALDHYATPPMIREYTSIHCSLKWRVAAQKRSGRARRPQNYERMSSPYLYFSKRSTSCLRSACAFSVSATKCANSV